MKNRLIPFGYEMQNGIIKINSGEATVVSRIFSEYLNGMALQSITDLLTEEKIEYISGKCKWNKSRVMRIIEDIRYIGDDKYPQIVTADIQSQALKLKSDKYNVDKKNSIIRKNYKQYFNAVLCKNCGSAMSHRLNTYDNRLEMWCCENDDCKCVTKLTVNDFFDGILQIMNIIISDTKIISDQQNTDILVSMEVKRLENEIERMLDSASIDKEAVNNLILQCATKKYDSIKSVRHITEQLTAAFEKSEPLSVFNSGLFEKTVSNIMLNEHGDIFLKLNNGSIVGKEVINNADVNIRTKGSCNSGNTGAAS